jgi:hypothetical protein
MPMGMAVHLYRPQGVLTAVSFMSSRCILVWKKLFVMSREVKSFSCPQSARMSEMSRSGKLSVSHQENPKKT